MTSLQNQLKKLQKAPTRALAVERDYSSLLFTKKQAAEHDREDFYKIGLGGLAGMKALDDNFDSYEPELFTKDKLNMNRAMLTKEEAEALNEQIEAMILRLCPYFHHQCCRQVLEWLIHKYQVHTYNAENLFLAFLPYHFQNTFGRLLQILKFNSPDFDWLSEYQKDAAPVPLNILCRACQAGRTYWLISAISTFVRRAIGLLDAEYVDTKMQHYFTFLVSLYGNLVEQQASRIDEQLLSRLLPFLGTALKSTIAPFKCAGMMLFCTLSMNVPLEKKVTNSLLKNLLNKTDLDMCRLVLEAANVICERLEVKELPKKPILRMACQGDDLNLATTLKSLMANYDMGAFLAPFWTILMDDLMNDETHDWRQEFTNLLIETLDLDLMSEQHANAVFGLLLDWVESVIEAEMEGDGERRHIFPRKLRKHIRSIVIRFPREFDAIRTIREANSVQRLIEDCRIQSHEFGELEMANNGYGTQKQHKKPKLEFSHGDGVEEEEDGERNISSTSTLPQL